ncbi:uncharacterized protein PHACADRAFT_252953 [Phanerochaete carnosa HHB-10118-sp]|uniref:Uncharacterized protein n=1 Tax=Phanerochaete carnosa (strain HHB-10118-sp) TaxID=650164 RepID=K5WGS8_PHACS|nr:uncharacterized protein PHACADRAFT_252953 [Phanerochaete carnosa HHB-10118-sp]EKM58535.1 hypothetical protein PHACADRAFT_252953 [Phanerochaete carnosa HHB-10118-sp]
MPLLPRVKKELQDAILTSDIPNTKDLIDFVNNFASDADIDAIKGLLNAAKSVSALKTFRMMRREAQTKRHCVRCHGSYGGEQYRQELPHSTRLRVRLLLHRRGVRRGEDIWVHGTVLHGPRAP